MNDSKEQTGYFLFSLDTELAWGYFDNNLLRSKKISADGVRERESIKRLLATFEEFGIIPTWAITGHLVYEKCEDCKYCPILEWENKYESFEEIYKTDNPLWYGSDIIETLLSNRYQHEIAFHGYSHQLFDEDNLREDQARMEIQEWLRISKRLGIVPKSLTFPRNVIGYLDLFKDSGFICYRGRENKSKFYQLPYVGKLIKHLDHFLSISMPHVYDMYECTVDGLVNLYPTQYFFDFNRNLELFLDSLNLNNIRIRRMVKALKKAAKEKKIIHIWAHPWEFQTENDFKKLRFLLGYVEKEIIEGRMQSIGMAELAKKIIEMPQ